MPTRVLNPVAPYSDNKYQYYSDLTAGNFLSSTCRILVEVGDFAKFGVTIDTNERELQGALTRQNNARVEFEVLMNELIKKTNFSDVQDILKNLSIIRTKLDVCCKLTNVVIQKIPESTSHKCGGKTQVSNEDRVPFQQELGLYELILNLFTCIDFAIRVVLDPDSCSNTFQAEFIKSARSLKTAVDEHFQNLPDYIVGSLNTFSTQFNELFDIVSIEEFFSEASIPKKFQGTVFDLPSEMTEIHLNLIMSLAAKFNKQEEALECYKCIISKNKSISVATIVACEDIIKHGQYELALDLLNMLIDGVVGEEGSSIQRLLDDAFILKLFCQVGLENFSDAVEILRTLPTTILDIPDVRLLQLEVYEKLYEGEISSFRGACHVGDLERIQRLVDENGSSLGFATLVNGPETLLYIINGKACSQAKKDIMSDLERKKFLDLNMNDGFALEVAVQKDDISLVQFLMSKGVKMPSYEDGILLFYAAQQNDYDMFFLLKNSYGIEIDQEILGEIKVLELSGALKAVIDGIDSHV